LTILTLGFLTPLFHDLPEAVLGAIVIHAVAHLADVGELKRFARLKTGSIWVSLTALAGVLTFGILKGLVLAVVLTLIALMKKLTTPNESVLGRLASTGTFVDTKRYPEAQPVPGVLIVRPNSILFFANANRFFNRLRQLMKEQGEALRAVILNFEAVSELDVTTLDLLEQLRGDLAASGIRLCLARVPDPVKELLGISGFSERLGADNQFWRTELAAEACEGKASG